MFDLSLHPVSFSQVLEVEQQHSTALQELSHTYTAEKEQLIEQYNLQLQVCECMCVNLCLLQCEFDI